MFGSAQGIFSFVDELGPAKIIHINVPSVGLNAIFVIDAPRSNAFAPRESAQMALSVEPLDVGKVCIEGNESYGHRESTIYPTVSCRSRIYDPSAHVSFAFRGADRTSARVRHFGG